ncbi:MAG: 50S ribosomal protein L35ae [Candidatus Aenigmarchaeota archaeon]|nr:50S ribosomal protein L35ae [Candidatus Aenigmarchaeota archaeon]
MEATISNFRGGKSTQKPNQMILIIEGIDNKSKASQFIGKKVSWKSPAGKEINGKIVSVHGNSGALRARFTRGLPGEALGKKIKIVE